MVSFCCIIETAWGFYYHVKCVFYFFLSPTVWDDPSDACRLQRKSRHVQVAAATRSRCELQWARTRVHGADVRRPVRYAVGCLTFISATLERLSLNALLFLCACREDRYHVDDVGRRGRNGRGQLCRKDGRTDGRLCWYVWMWHSHKSQVCLSLLSSHSTSLSVRNIDFTCVGRT